mgnify:CR=1 FL=1
MGFYIYENWQAGPRKAVIHDGACAFCNDGVGRAGGYDPAHATWHGPYKSLEIARSRQKAMDVKVRRECRCLTR